MKKKIWLATSLRPEWVGLRELKTNNVNVTISTSNTGSELVLELTKELEKLHGTKEFILLSISCLTP